MSALGRGLIILASLQPVKRGRGRPRKHLPANVHRTLLGDGLVIRRDGTVDVKRKRGERKRIPRKYSAADVEQIRALVEQQRGEGKTITQRKALLELLKKAAKEKWPQLTNSSIKEKAKKRLPAIQMLLARYRAKK